jgi:hypothetical protein
MVSTEMDVPQTRFRESPHDAVRSSVRIRSRFSPSLLVRISQTRKKEKKNRNKENPIEHASSIRINDVKKIENTNPKGKKHIFFFIKKKNKEKKNDIFCKEIENMLFQAKINLKKFDRIDIRLFVFFFFYWFILLITTLFPLFEDYTRQMCAKSSRIL